MIEMKRAFLVVTHGEMGIGTLNSMQLLMGKQENVSALALREGDSVDELSEKISTKLHENAKAYDETVIVVDLLGGSPSNVALRSLAEFHDLKIVTGLSLPLLINLVNFSAREENTTKLIEDSVRVAHEGIKILDKNFLKNNI